ncbi:MAG: MATE family efflux transporter [Lentisphaeria bacterium]|nr:MATE family efflux transporter [Lentisphaeria bacterium]
MSSGKKYQIDMCHGPIFSKIVIFTIPLIAANVMATLFNSADMIVVGRFANTQALAAVGATSGLTALVLNMFFGLSSGVSVLATRFIGARDNKSLNRVVHTAIAIAAYGGTAMAILGIIISRPVLKLMGTPPEILTKACIYMWIYCAGIPFVVLYTFGSAILRATGDTRRPLFYMIFAGILNVLLNLFFVIVCKMDVAGVAIATKIANLVSAWLVIKALRRADDATHFSWRKMKLDWKLFLQMLRLGVPAGIQGSCFSVSNIIIQSAINSFGAIAIAGNTAAMNIDGLVYMTCVCFFHTSLNFTGQNYGAKKYHRIVRSILLSMLCTAACGVIVGGTGLILGKQLLGIYTTDAEVISWGMFRLKIMLSTYFLCGVMDAINGGLRGLGYSFIPMFVSVMGICVFRIFWVYFILPINNSLPMLITSYPISWLGIIIINGSILYFALKRLLASRKKKTLTLPA